MTDAVELAKAAAHPLRIRIIQQIEKQARLFAAARARRKADPKAELDGEDRAVLAAGPDLSPNRLSQLLGEPLGNVSYHVKTLLEYGCLEQTKTEPRRGAVEHFYRSTGVLSGNAPPALSDNQRGLVVDAIALALESMNGSLAPEDRAELEAARGILEVPA